MNRIKALIFLSVGLVSILYSYRTPTKMLPARRIGAFIGGLGLIALRASALLGLIDLN